MLANTIFFFSVLILLPAWALPAQTAPDIISAPVDTARIEEQYIYDDDDHDYGRDEAPNITSSPVTAVMVGIEYEYKVKAEGKPKPKFNLTTGPSGMTINAKSGVIKWTPASTGFFDVVVVAENKDGIDEQHFTIQVTPAPKAPVITSSPLEQATADQAYQYQVQASGYPDPSFSLTNAPAGMSVNTTSGLIQWTPSGSGEFEVTLKAANAQGADTQSYSISVSSQLAAPIITTAPISQALVGLPYAYQIEATGSPEPAFTLLEGPTGMSIAPQATLLTWTPETMGVYDVVLEARNSQGTFVQRFQLLVGVLGEAPLVQLQAALLTDHEAITLYALSNPNGNATWVVFEYGIDRVGEYRVTASPEFIDGRTAQQVVARIDGLPQGQTYVYRAVAENSIGRQESAIETFTTYSSSYQIGVEHAFDGTIDSLAYRLFSVPGAIDLDVALTLEGQRGEDWGVFADNGQPTDYLEAYDGSEAFHFRSGRGFWILTRTNWTVPEQTVLTAPLDGLGQFEMTLKAGWNIIASPFTESVDWTHVKEASDAVAPTSKLWGFEGVFEETATLEPYRAYYYFNDGPDGTVLSIPYPGLRQPAASQRVSKKGEAAVLRLEAIRGDSLRTAVEFMIDPVAETGKDRLDQYAPRNGFSGLSLLIEPAFEAPYGFLALEARPSIGEGVVHSVVLNARAGERLSLQALAIERFAGQEVYFVNGVTGEFVSLRSGDPVTLYPERDRTRNQLVIGTPAFVAEQRAELAPEAFLLEQNYPNPFGSSTTITYSLPEEGYVDLRVYNVLGQEVQRLMSGSRTSGFYRMNWDGTASGGAPLPAGVYLLRMRTENGAEKNRSMTKVQ